MSSGRSVRWEGIRFCVRLESAVPGAVRGSFRDFGRSVLGRILERACRAAADVELAHADDDHEAEHHASEETEDQLHEEAFVSTGDELFQIGHAGTMAFGARGCKEPIDEPPFDLSRDWCMVADLSE
jgi:hypothetical protein